MGKKGALTGKFHPVRITNLYIFFLKKCIFFVSMKKLSGKKAFVAGVGDDNGYGWAIAKALFAEGCDIILGVWPPVYNIFTGSFEKGKFDESRRTSDGSMLSFLKVYAFDATFDKIEDVPQEIRENKRYVEHDAFTISEIAALVERDFGKIDMFVHSLANGPEVKLPLLETSRKGYLAAVSASSYSFVSAVRHFGPRMHRGGAFINLSYIAAEKAVPGYGGGMSSAKAALESDTKMLAFEAGRAWGVRINGISAGPLASRAAKAIGFIEKMIEYTKNNSPLGRELSADEVGAAACFLLSPAASAITGAVIPVDLGMSCMAVAVDSPAFTL